MYNRKRAEETLSELQYKSCNHAFWHDARFWKCAIPSKLHNSPSKSCSILQDLLKYWNQTQGCALAAPGRLRRLTFGLRRLKKKSGRPSGRLDFGLCENPKRNVQTYWNGTKRKKLPHAPALLLAQKTKALIAQCNSISCVIYIRCTSSLFHFVGFTSGLLIWYMAQLSWPLNNAIKRATDWN